MKVAIVGGGPSGLFLAILLKKRMTDVVIEVYEQNPRDATFGFGVVMADTGLNRISQADPELSAELMSAMHFNDRQTIISNETPIVVTKPGQGGGAIPRIKLLSILADHTAKLGIDVRYNCHIDDVADIQADIIVGADGVNSLVRSKDEEAFGTSRRSLSNHFAWFGTHKVFANPALVFRRFRGGYFIAHYYPYSDAMSTFVAECDHQTWVDLHMEEMTLEQRQELFETIFSGELDGFPLISNNSTWRQFPVIRNKNWHSGNKVLIGDALSSAHFSIGSGTRIAMEDAIALADAICANPTDINAAFAAYVNQRGPEKDKLINASEKSFTWYEHIREWMDAYSPYEFVYRFMTRTGRVDRERLQRHYPELLKKIEEAGIITDMEPT
ncbi:FAD-dependent monooxygenase [Noviherbaspirillum saxi]|uniref:Monooxygenase n=1 Tax=Noviherbaspirillum saxi TaxID=2320863 RepID=A0A3A3FJ11_9BURK|nr:FAD-dependent monooxygenase [Noviherbaspirillum saxi]RJF95483.1 monooxygenase [Noviherbaspirillum saxi]